MGGGPGRFTDLPTLARHLAANGPHKLLPAQPRRIRILFANAFIADTTNALYVWEHEFYPQLYLPMEAFVKPAGFDVVLSSGEAIEDAKGTVIGGQLRLSVRPTQSTNEAGVNGRGSGQYRTLDEMILFAADLEGPAKALRNYVKVNFAAVDQWFEEDLPIYVHPKDPFKRVDCLPSNRPIRVSVDGVILAESSTSVHLFETTLPCRYYLPYTSINTEYLRPSSTMSECPYKGVANYHDVVITPKAGDRTSEGGSSGEKTYKDLIWWYRQPTLECAKVEGMRCFYNEKVDIWMQDSNGQWAKLDRPVTHFV